MAYRKKQLNSTLVGVIVGWFALLGVMVLLLQLMQRDRVSTLNTEAASVDKLHSDNKITVLQLELYSLKEDPYLVILDEISELERDSQVR